MTETPREAFTAIGSGLSKAILRLAIFLRIMNFRNIFQCIFIILTNTQLMTVIRRGAGAEQRRKATMKGHHRNDLNI